jgi:hypothetical protein
VLRSRATLTKFAAPAAAAVVATLAFASPAQAAVTPTFHLKNGHSQQCLAVGDSSKADGAAVVQWECDANYDQQWVLEYKGSPEGASEFLIRNRNSWKCLAIGGGSKVKGAEAIQFECSNSRPEQYWKFDSSARLRNNVSDLCLAIPGASEARGEHAIQWTCKDVDTNPEQYWGPIWVGDIFS